jgi:predicted alpha/beta hydrolase family esterase
MKKRVFIVHGWGGSPEGDWLLWLKKELEKRKIMTVAPQMPDTDNPRIEKWVPHLAKAAGKCDKDTYFIGHSMGCQTILRYLEQLPEDIKTGGAVFAAGWFNLLNLDKNEEEIAGPWLKTPIDFKKIKNHTKKFVAIFSDDDPYVPLSDKDTFKEKLAAKIIIEHDKKHMNDADLPVALNELLKIME